MESTTNTHQFRYGKKSSLQLKLPSGVLLAECGLPNGTDIVDAVAATTTALEEPLNYPPLRKSTFAGDRVILAVAHDVPQSPALIAGLIETLTSAGVHPYDLRVLLPPKSKLGDKATAQVPEETRRHIVIEEHDPKDRDRLAYLAAAKSAKPIYVNRSLCDADLVIPVGCIRNEGALGNHGIGTVFPTFSDRETIRRFRAPAAWLSKSHRKVRASEVAEATWLLGARFTVQVIAGAGKQIVDVLAGDIDAVKEEGEKRLAATWGMHVEEPAELVIVSMSGGAKSQTWNDLACAVQSAIRFVKHRGSIVICSELKRRPGKAMRHLFEMSDLDEADRRIKKERSDDAVAAKQLVEALRNNRVYLLSKLENEVVEDLGIAPISNPGEIENLCRRHESCILLSNAKYAFFAEA